MLGADIYMNDGNGSGGGDLQMDGGDLYNCDTFFARQIGGNQASPGPYFLEFFNDLVSTYGSNLVFSDVNGTHGKITDGTYTSIDPYNRINYDTTGLIPEFNWQGGSVPMFPSGIIDKNGSTGSAGQVLTANGSGGVEWV